MGHVHWQTSLGCKHTQSRKCCSFHHKTSRSEGFTVESHTRSNLIFLTEQILGRSEGLCIFTCWPICMYENGTKRWERSNGRILLWITLIWAPLPDLSSENVDAQCGDSPSLLWKEHFHPFHSLLLRKSRIFALLHPPVLFTSFPLSRKLPESLLIVLFFCLQHVYQFILFTDSSAEFWKGMQIIACIVSWTYMFIFK